MRRGKVLFSNHAGSLESIILDGAKWILGCFLRPVMIEAVRRDMGLDTLQSHRDSEIYNL